MNFQVAVVFDETQFAELVHEEADPRPCGADDLGQSLLADLRDDRLGLAFLAEISQQEQHSCQSLFAGVEELVHQIFLDSDVPGKQVLQEQFGKGRLFVEHSYRVRLIDPHDRARDVAVAVAMRIG